ncbi:ATP-binding cassette domain-containing protein [Treponema putidum]|uniref:ATP-binding cassette domain-containing protein n=1 Tax=Treponema putidum TaxID=221027 RepID=UPI003D8E1003
MNKINFSNINWCLKKLFDQRKITSIFILFMYIFSSVSVTYIASALPGIILKIVSLNINNFYTAASFIVLTFLIFFTVSMLSHIFLYFFQLRSFKTRFTMIPKVSMRVLEIDYEILDSAEGKTAIDKAYEAVYSGRARGVEYELNQFGELSVNLWNLILFCVLSFYTSVFLTAYVVVMGILIVLIKHRSTQWLITYKSEKNTIQAKEKYLVTEIMSEKSAKDIRLYKLQDWFSTIFENMYKALTDWNINEQKSYMKYDILELLLFVIRDSVIFIYLYNMLKTDSMQIADAVMYYGIVLRFNSWLNSISRTYSNLLQNDVIINDLRKFFALPFYKTEGIQNDKIDIQKIEFKNVSYRAKNSGKDIIKNISFIINKGDKIGIVGANGAGKTTVIKLLLGLYKPTSGEIYINDKNAETFSISERLSMFSVLFQDNALFAFTIAQNITCKNDNTDTEVLRLSEVLKRTGLETKINALSKKTETVLFNDLEEGINLSGGEKQRLLMARVLYHNTDFYILDEPTSALDAIQEKNMYQLYNSELSNKTSVFISHRLGSTAFCSNIFFMKDGQIIKSGTNEELLQACEEYKNMYNVQQSFYTGDEKK